MMKNTSCRQKSLKKGKFINEAESEHLHQLHLKSNQAFQDSKSGENSVIWAVSRFLKFNKVSYIYYYYLLVRSQKMTSHNVSIFKKNHFQRA